MDGFLFQPEEGTDNEYGEDDYEYDYESERRAAEQSEQQAVLNAASPEERREQSHGRSVSGSRTGGCG